MSSNACVLRLTHSCSLHTNARKRHVKLYTMFWIWKSRRMNSLCLPLLLFIHLTQTLIQSPMSDWSRLPAMLYRTLPVFVDIKLHALALMNTYTWIVFSSLFNLVFPFVHPSLAVHDVCKWCACLYAYGLRPVAAYICYDYTLYTNSNPVSLMIFH